MAGSYPPIELSLRVAGAYGLDEGRVKVIPGESGEAGSAEEAFGSASGARPGPSLAEQRRCEDGGEQVDDHEDSTVSEDTSTLLQADALIRPVVERGRGENQIEVTVRVREVLGGRGRPAGRPPPYPRNPALTD